MIAMCDIIFDTLKTIWCWRKRSNVKILGSKWSNLTHIYQLLDGNSFFWELTELCNVYSERNMVSPDGVVSLSLTRALSRSTCMHKLYKKKWTKVCYMLCSYKCLVTNIWPYLRMMELIFNYCIRWKIGSLNDIGNIMTKLLLMVIMIISHRSQSQSTLASWKAIIFVFFPTFHSNHFNP